MNAPPEPRPVAPLETAFRLDGLTIDPRAGDVSGPGGRETLDPKVMGVLLRLAQQAGQVVTREDLFANVWPGVVVSEYALSRCIYELRRQLSQAGGAERYKAIVETLPKRGYRLNVQIDASPTAADARPTPADERRAPMSTRHVAAIGGVLVLAAVVWLAATRWTAELANDSAKPSAAARTASIAVLPFVDMSETQDQQYLSDGIAEEILNQLTRVEDLRVIARTSSFTFRGQDIDIRDIGAKLGVSHVLEGSVRRSGDRLRVTAQLINASNNLHMWAKTYDRASGDVLAVQDEIAASVATALDLALSDQAAAPPAPVDAAAHELFLQGQFFFSRRAPGDVVRAAKYYEQALEIEPRYTQAWAALAGAYSVLGETGEVARPVARARQREAAQRALALDPRSADAHWRVAQLYFETGDLDAACRHSRVSAALDQEPSTQPDSECWTHWPFGDAEREIALERQRVAEDPLSAVGHINLAVMLVAAGHLEEANAELLTARDLRAGNALDVDVELVRVLVLQRRYDDALATIAHLPEGEARDHGTALLFDAPGQRADADAALARLVERREPAVMSNLRLAEVLAFRGMSDRALSALESTRQAIDLEDEGALAQIWWLQQEMSMSPFLVPLQPDARWQALMALPAGVAQADPAEMTGVPQTEAAP